VTTAILTHAGGRDENQDAADFVELPGMSCWVLADGLGGHGGGGVASRVTMETIHDAFRHDAARSLESLGGYLERANAAVCDRQSQPGLKEMRTTAVVLLSDGKQARWAHIGDSRLYHLRGGRICFQTEDHSVPQAMSNAGEITPDQIRFHEDRNRLLRTLGSRESFRPAVNPAPVVLEAGDAFLLASDGFWEYVHETEMEVEFAKSADPAEWLARMERRLRQRATSGHDNYTAIAVWI